MHLTLHSDYALRVLIYLAHFPERRCNTTEISSVYDISRHHLVRVVQTLAGANLICVHVGRQGGMTLARPASEIRLGSVLRITESNFRLVECHEPESNTCPIVGFCGLNGILRSAAEVFLRDLDKHTLADLVSKGGREAFGQLQPTTREPSE